MHILMNTMTFLSIGSSLERTFGSLWLGVTILWSILLTSFTYILISYTIYFIGGGDQLLYQHSLGFSGVLFHLTVLQSYRFSNSTRDILGFIRVSSTVYPWVLLFGIQIILPNISFLGHLSGILVGISQVYGILDIFCLPSPEYLYSLDQAEFFTSRLQSIGISEKYIRSAPPSDSSWTSIRRDPSSLFKSLYESAIMIVSLIWNFVETLKVIIFGSRFRTEDMNILQSTFDDYDEEEFVGLPTTSR